MPKIVVKFGGSNLRDKEEIGRILEVIRNYDQPLVIVVSAFFGVTNFLIQALEQARHDESVAKSSVDYLHNLKMELIPSFIQDQQLLEETESLLKQQLDELGKYLQGIALTGDASKALEDLVLSYGERLSAVFLNGILKSSGMKSELAFPENVGLITDGEYGNATADFALSENKVQQALSGEHHYVLPGYYGVSPQGRVTLFGRGGGDYAAAAFARCIHAKSLDIWKDVNGFLSSDPKMVANPVLIEQLSYNEAAELAYFGAKILHPRTVEPLTFPRIPVRIFNIYGSLDINHPLTIISKEKSVHQGVIKSVTFSDQFGLLKLKGPGVGIKPGILAKVTTALHHAGINISSVLTSQIAINILLARKDLNRAYDVVSTIELSAVGKLQIEEDISVVATVGHGITDNYGVAARIFAALAAHGINVVMSCSGASPIVSYYLVKSEDRSAAVQAIHHEFFEKS
ncbi:MAG: aspartate kinase [Marinilabiliales bacterium]|nr:aspartate kinase [Marinilabiliales bacterium]